jgi:hypothetical protein
LLRSTLGSFINDPMFSAFSAIPQLNRTDADVSILLLHNRAMYTYPVTDPFFKSTTHRTDASAMFFTADQDLGVIGCTEQYQFCNGALNCTAPIAWGQYDRESVKQALGYNNAQLALFDVIYHSALIIRLFSILFMLEDTALLASDLLYGTYGVSTGLPDNQWQREIENLHNISMAAMQQSVVAHASAPDLSISYGPNSTTSYGWLKQDTLPEQQKICRNQKIKALGYYSFNVLGLSLTLSFGIIIIVLGSVAPSIANYWRRKAHGPELPSVLDMTDLPSYRTEEWKCSDPLHLHAVALKGHGVNLRTDSERKTLSLNRKEPFQLPWLIDWSSKTFYIE